MKKGFTFIEVLVVITIISVLTLIGVTNFRVANQKARDGRRQGDLEQIKAALELYRTNFRVYPTTGNLNSLTPTYIGTIPPDPLSGRLYAYTSDGSTYTLCAGLELTTAGVSGCGSCGSLITCSYKITSPL